MDLKCKKECFFRGIRCRLGRVYTFPDNTKLDAEQKTWFEVMEPKKKPGPKSAKVKNDSTTDSESGSAEAES